MEPYEVLQQNKYTKLRQAVLIGAVIGLYALKYYGPDFIRNAPVFIYLISPALWTLLIFTVLSFPRPRPRGKLRTKGTCIWMSCLCSVFHILVIMLCGIIAGFGKNPFDHSLPGISINIFKVFPALIATEMVRSYLVNADRGRANFRWYAAVTIGIALMRLNPRQIVSLKTNLSVLEFVGVDVLGGVSSSVFATYLVFVGGPALSVIYLGIQQSFYWFCPILPNLSWIAQAFIDILLPVFGMMIFHFVYGKESKNQKIHAEEDANPMGWIAVTVISVLIIWFAVGVFPIRPYVILTGSMEPVIKPGDIVLVQRYDPNETLQVGDIIQYRSGEIFVFHRLIEIFEEDKVTKYRMKGDNNPTEDPAPVETKDLRGRVIKIIPKIGYPALFLKSVIRR